MGRMVSSLQDKDGLLQVEASRHSAHSVTGNGSTTGRMVHRNYRLMVSTASGIAPAIILPMPWLNDMRNPILRVVLLALLAQTSPLADNSHSRASVNSLMDRGYTERRGL